MMKRKEPEEEDGVNLHQGAKSMKTDNSDKEKKYDRQLRLWGDHGQNALENSRVCLLNASATGSELLKSLVLPGIGSITIVDDGSVTEQHVGGNFFLTTECIGKPIAASTCQYLQELNPSCKGNFIIKSADEIIENEPHLLREFDVVISSRLKHGTLCQISQYLWEYQVPHLICDSYGFLGYLRLDIQEHTVIESHPDNTLPDLRLQNPFPSLIQFIDRYDMDSLNHHDHSHVPYLIIISKALCKWRESSQKIWPTSYKEKCAIKDIIKSWVWKNEDGLPELEENFEEALKNINNVVSNSSMPSSILQILSSAEDLSNKIHNIKFWILSKAVYQFVKTSGSLPLRGSIPDMFCDSATFIQLQRCFKAKADEDVQMVKNIVDGIVEEMNFPTDGISLDEIKLFCRNSSFLNVLHGNPYHKQLISSSNLDDITDLDVDSLTLTLLPKAMATFYERHNRFPGTESCTNEDDNKELENIFSEIQSDLKLSQTISMDLVDEICRWKSSEVHPICAVLAGIASQEVIKVITKQYVPIDNTLIYNAITQETTVMKL